MCPFSEPGPLISSPYRRKYRRASISRLVTEIQVVGTRGSINSRPPVQSSELQSPPILLPHLLLLPLSQRRVRGPPFILWPSTCRYAITIPPGAHHLVVCLSVSATVRHLARSLVNRRRRSPIHHGRGCWSGRLALTHVHKSRQQQRSPVYSHYETNIRSFCRSLHLSLPPYISWHTTASSAEPPNDIIPISSSPMAWLDGRLSTTSASGWISLCPAAVAGGNDIQLW